MDDLIKALQIFRKYGNPESPTICGHDIMYIVGIRPDEVSEKDKKTLDKLGFHVGDSDGFESYRFGSA